MSPMAEIESDLKVIHRVQPRAHRVFLTGANPFVLTTHRLLDIGLLVRKYVGEGQPTIGCFARITDITKKSIEELRQLHHLGFDYLTIGVESGDSETLARMNKGYVAEDILEQCLKLEAAGIRYNFFYLVGLAGRGNGERNASRSAAVFNQLHPVSIGFLSLTLFPESQLYNEIAEGIYQEATELERLDEMISLVSQLTGKTHILARTVSNPIPFTGSLPKEQLRSYRDSIESL